MRQIILAIYFLVLLAISLVFGNKMPALALSPKEEALGQLNVAAGESGANIIGSGPMDPRLIAAIIIRASLAFVGIFFVVLIMYAGFLWMTAGGEEDKISRARKLITNSVIGLAVILSAYSITYFIFKTVLGVGVSYANPFGYGFTSNVTNYGPNPANYNWYTGN